MDFKRFLDMHGITLREVQAGTGLDIGGLCRIKNGETLDPRMGTMLMLSRWAHGVAIKRRLPREQRLTWPGFIYDPRSDVEGLEEEAGPGENHDEISGADPDRDRAAV